MTDGVVGRDFFISFAGVNRAWAKWIAAELERANYTTVVQTSDFRPGTDFVHRMQQAAATAKRTIAVLSPAYFASEYSEAEWRAAFVRDSTGEAGVLPPFWFSPVSRPASSPAGFTWIWWGLTRVSPAAGSSQRRTRIVPGSKPLCSPA